MIVQLYQLIVCLQQALLSPKLVLSGACCRFLDSVAVLDDVTKQWYRLPPLNHARAGLGLVGVAGRLFAVGGWRDHQYSRQGI